MGASNADYERQFKELVAKAKAVYGTGAYDDSTLEFLIPGLRESEDERIRKALICGLSEGQSEHNWQGFGGATIDECLAYLEKQKEEEGYDAIPVESTLEYKLGFKAGKESEKQKEQKSKEPGYKHEDYFCERCQANAFNAGRESVLKEQKPVQTSEEKEYIRTLKSLISDFIRDKQPEDIVFYQKIYDWLDGRHIEQEPNIELIQRSWYMEGYHDREFGKEPKWILKTGKGGPKHELNPRYGQPLAKEQKPVEGKEYTSPDCGTSACCDDERFEIIAQAKRDIIEKTNIAENELSMELPLLDGILMRVWQVGWLNKKPAEWSEATINGESIPTENQSVDIPLAEWSEEDEKLRLNLMSLLANMRGDRITEETYQKYYPWLKSLKNRGNFPKSNTNSPNEWSEEDEDMRANILSVLGCFVGTAECESNPSLSTSYPTYRREMDWLKSLRPSWKPSEEQQEVDLEKAAQHVYESWMGGTMDYVRRDMVTLGTVLNARKEQSK